MNGKKTRRIIALRYTLGRTFTHNLLGSYEIPDNADCVELSTDVFTKYSKTYTKTYDYRLQMANDAGVGFGSFKEGYFIGSDDYQYYRDFVFENESFTSQQKRVFQYYKCSIETFRPIYYSQVEEKLKTLNNNEIIDDLGTHIIEEAEFGGFINVEATISSCVLASLTKNEVESEINFAFASIAASLSYTSSCDIVNTYFEFQSEVGGGDRNLLRGQGIESTNYDPAWRETIREAPTATSTSLHPIEKLPVFKDLNMEDNILSYVDVAIPEEIEIDEDQDICTLIEEGIVTCYAETDDMAVGKVVTVGWISYMTFVVVVAFSITTDAFL